MPRVKPLTENERKDLAVREQLIGKMQVRHINGETLAEMVGVSRNTMYRRIKEPDTLTLKEIREIKKAFPGIVIE